MGLLEQCEELFKTTNLYEVIGTTKEATEAEVRRGYYKVSLTVHPDRVPDDPQATTKFQTLGKVYAVLSDKDLRAIYDEQGIVDEDEDSIDRNRDWTEYWRVLFPKITLQDILDFEKSYKGSKEEEEDLRRVYNESEGNMTKIMESMLCSVEEDEERYRAILQSAIDQEEIPAYKDFTHENPAAKTKRKRVAKKEAKEAELMKREMGLAADSNLLAVMQRKRQSNEMGFNSLIANLEDKYCKKKTPAAKKGKKK